MAFPYQSVRPRNAVMYFKQETTVGTDASPTSSDAFPFEADGWSYNSPYATEDANENTGTMVDGLPLIVGQQSVIRIRVRVKGVGGSTDYSSTVKPPHHALLQCCGWKGLFTAAVSAQALAAGTTTTATLGNSYAATAGLYRGQPLILNGSPAGTNRIVTITDYKSSRLTTLADIFGSSLGVGVTAALPANWTYAPTSPRDAATRATDQPSGTLYIYEDGKLLKFLGCRGNFTLSADTARPGFAEFMLMGIFAGETAASVPTVSLSAHAAPVLAQGDGGITPAFMVNRVELAIKSLSLGGESRLETADDPNTPFGYGSPDIDGRATTFTIDPLNTLKANIDRFGEIVASTQMPLVARFGQTALNRWSLFGSVAPVQADPGQRGIFRTDQMRLRGYTPGADSASRDGDATLCFY